MIKLIILDLYGVVTHGSYKETCQWLAKKHSRKYADVYKIVYHKYFNQAAMGKLTEAKFFSRALKELKIPLNWKTVRDKHLSFQRPNKPVVELARQLQRSGIKVLVLSKNIPPHFNYLRKKFSLDKLFPQMINTYDLGLPKASVKTIRYILKRFKVKPSEVIMVDDQNFNLAEPKKLGVRTILYGNYRALRQKMKMTPEISPLPIMKKIGY